MRASEILSQEYQSKQLAFFPDERRYVHRRCPVEARLERIIEIRKKRLERERKSHGQANRYDGWSKSVAKKLKDIAKPLLIEGMNSTEIYNLVPSGIITDKKGNKLGLSRFRHWLSILRKELVESGVAQPVATKSSQVLGMLKKGMSPQQIRAKTGWRPDIIRKAYTKFKAKQNDSRKH
jgi:hypothetical protein